MFWHCQMLVDTQCLRRHHQNGPKRRVWRELALLYWKKSSLGDCELSSKGVQYFKMWMKSTTTSGTTLNETQLFKPISRDFVPEGLGPADLSLKRTRGGVNLGLRSAHNGVAILWNFGDVSGSAIQQTEGWGVRELRRSGDPGDCRRCSVLSVSSI